MSAVIRHEIKRRLKRRLMPDSGLFWFPVDDLRLVIEWPTSLAKQIYYKGVYHPETVKYLRENIGLYDVCVDVGANVGYLTMIMARQAYWGRVIAFEPDPRLRHILRLNLKANNIEGVHVRHEAVSDENGRSRFFLNREPMYSGLVGHTGIRDIIDVDTVTLDSSVGPVNIVKIDVEGAECRVLRGMKKMLRHNPDMRLILEVEPDRPGFSEELYSLLDGWRFRNLDRLNVLCWRDEHV